MVVGVVDGPIEEGQPRQLLEIGPHRTRVAPQRLGNVVVAEQQSRVALRGRFLLQRVHRDEMAAISVRPDIETLDQEDVSCVDILDDPPVRHVQPCGTGHVEARQFDARVVVVVPSSSVELSEVVRRAVGQQRFRPSTARPAPRLGEVCDGKFVQGGRVPVRRVDLRRRPLHPRKQLQRRTMGIAGRSPNVDEGQRADPGPVLDEGQQIDRAADVQASAIAKVRKRGQYPSAPGVRQVVVDEPGHAAFAAKPHLLRPKRQSYRIERESAGAVEVAGRVAEVHPADMPSVLLHDAIGRVDDTRDAAADMDVKPGAGRQRGSPRRTASR